MSFLLKERKPLTVYTFHQTPSHRATPSAFSGPAFPEDSPPFGLLPQFLKICLLFLPLSGPELRLGFHTTISKIHVLEES